MSSQERILLVAVGRKGKPITVEPTLSVLFPNYNDARFLPTQLRSILGQSYRPKEIIIIDDASTDDSVKVIEGFIAQESRIRLIRNAHNLGVEQNMNRLIAEASGDYLYLSAADDMVMPNFFERSMVLLSRYPQAGLCSGIGRMMNEQGIDTGLRSLPVISRHPCFLPPGQVRRMLSKYGRWFALSSMIIKKSALVAEGGQIAAVGSFADNLAAMVVALRHGACFIPEEFSSWRQKTGAHGSSSSTDWTKLLEQGRLIVQLMRTRYADLFPTGYVEAFEGHWIYKVHVSAAGSVKDRATKNFAAVMSAVPMVPSAVDRAWVFVLGTLTCLQRPLWRLYAMLRFGPWKWWILGRLSITLNHGRVLIREDQRP